MRRLFTIAGLTQAELRWGERTGRWSRADRGVWAEGPEEVGELDRARAAVMATGGVASHHLAGVLHGLDAVDLDGTWVTLPRTSNGRRPRVTAEIWRRHGWSMSRGSGVRTGCRR